MAIDDAESNGLLRKVVRGIDSWGCDEGEVFSAVLTEAIGYVLRFGGLWRTPPDAQHLLAGPIHSSQEQRLGK